MRIPKEVTLLVYVRYGNAYINNCSSCVKEGIMNTRQSWLELAEMDEVGYKGLGSLYLGSLPEGVF